MKKHPEIPKDDFLFIYDNAGAHVHGFAGWFSRQMPGFKLSIPPKTPEVFYIYHYNFLTLV